MLLKSLFIIMSSLCLSSSMLASDESFKQLEPQKIEWPFSGITGSFDSAAVQRGYQVYKEVCSACHALNRVSFRNLRAVGFSEADVKALAASYQVKDGPNDSGDMFERPGTPSDHFVSPFANKQAAMAANNGAMPPDLSLIIKARHDGANYVHSLIGLGYRDSQIDENGLHTNPYFSTGKLAMAPPLVDGLVQYSDGTEATVDNMAKDVVNFLQWAAEPEMEARKSMGIKIVSVLSILTVLFFWANKRLWSSLKR